MNLVLIIVTALLALATGMSAHGPAPTSAAPITVVDASTTAVVVPQAVATVAPTPTANDVVSGSGPSH